jgi:hypothetical protein
MRQLVVFGAVGIAGLLAFSGIFENEAMYGRIHADAQGYYGYLVAAVLEGTFDWQIVIDSYSETYFNGNAADFTVETDFGRINKYYVGTAVLLLPFFLLSCLATILFGFPVDGYSMPFQAGVVVSALFYAGVGMYYLSRFLERKKIEPWIALLVSVLCLFGTQLFHYSVSEPAMSHAYSFGLFGLFLYSANDWALRGGLKRLLIMVVVLALIALIRPVNILIVLGAPFAAGGLKPLVSKIKLELDIKAGGLVIFLGLLVVSVQFIAYFLQVGRPVVWSYHGEGFDFSSPELYGFLFSFKKGLFVYTPLSLLGFLGIIFWSVRKPKEGGWLLLLLAVSVYVLSSWWNWYYGSSFGMRAMTEFMPFFAIGLAYLLQKSTTIVRTVILTVCLFFVSLNLVQSYQYQHFILHWDGMNLERYWKVFLKTARSYDGIFYRQPEPEIVDTRSFFTNIDSLGTEWGQQGVMQGIAFSGTRSTLVNNSVPYGATLGLLVTELGPPGAKKLRFSAMAWANEIKPELSVAYSYRAPDGDYAHTYIPVGHLIMEKKKWVKVEVETVLIEPQDSSHVWVVYPHNPTDVDVYLDDLNYEVTTFQQQP